MGVLLRSGASGGGRSCGGDGGDGVDPSDLMVPSRLKEGRVRPSAGGNLHSSVALEDPKIKWDKFIFLGILHFRFY